jgi:hypothetical protein
MQTISGEHPPDLTAQIAWLRDRVVDAAQFRELLVSSRNVNADKAETDAEMWHAVLSTVAAIAAGSVK